MTQFKTIVRVICAVMLITISGNLKRIEQQDKQTCSSFNEIENSMIIGKTIGVVVLGFDSIETVHSNGEINAFVSIATQSRFH